MERNKKRPITPLTDLRSTWKPFDWSESSNFFESTAQGRQMLESYQEAERELEEKRRKKQEEAERIAEIRRKDRERAAKVAAEKRKQFEERIRQQEEARNAQNKETEKQKDAADEVEERDFQNWSEGKWWKDNFFGRRYYDIRNALGSLVTSSIDTNGNNIYGRMSMNELRKQSADAHSKMLDLQQLVETLKEQRDLNKELGSNNIAGFDNAIRQVEQQMSDPTLKGLDDAYKQLYVAEKQNTAFTIGDVPVPTFGAMWEGVKGALTYDQYRPEVQLQQKQRMLLDYDRLIADEKVRRDNEKYTRMPLDAVAKQMPEDLARNIGNQLRNPEQARQDNISKIFDTERNVVKNVKDKADAELAELREEYIANRTHLKDSQEYWDVAEGFKMNTQAHLNDALWNPYYYLYSLAPMIGSSMSSPAQAAGSVIKGVGTIGGLALAPFTEGGSLGLMYVSELAATPFELKGARDENYAEIADRRIENIKNLLNDTSFTGDTENQDKSTYDRVMDELKSRSTKVWKQRGWSDEQIQKYLDGEEGDKHVLQDYTSGITSGAVKGQNGKPLFGELGNPAFLKALVFSTAGLQAQFDADNMRTMGELPAQKAMMLLPTSWLKKGSGIVKDEVKHLSSKIADKIKKDAAGRVTASATEEAVETGAKQAATTKYVNGFRRPDRTFGQAVKAGWNKGSELGDALGFGYAGHVVGGTVGGAAEGIAHAARASLNPRLRALYDGMEERVLMKYQLALDKLTPEKAWQKALLKYGMNATGRNIGVGFSEAAEEAVQYLNSKEDFASKYGWSGMSIADMVANDLHQGGRVLDAYMSLLGITNSELKDDEEYWSNLKGGFILGALPMANPSGIIQVAGNTVRGYKEYKTADAMISSAVMNREHDKINRASNAEFARQAIQGNEQHVLNVINNMEAVDRRRENPFFTQEDYDEKRKAALQVMSMAKNSSIREMLEAKGIEYGTDKYATAIADLYNVTNSLQENQKQTSEVGSKRNQLYNSDVFQHAVEEVIDRVMNESAADKQDVDNIIKKAGDEAVVAEIDAIREELQLDPNSKKYSRVINSPEYKQRIAEARERAEEGARQLTRLDMRNAVTAKTKLVNRLSSLIRMKARHNTIDDFYTFLNDKFGLTPMRPDAKTIRDNVDQQIKEAKEQLAELTKDTSDAFDSNFTDAQALDYLDAAQDVVHTREEDLQDLEATMAMLSADRAVSQSYYNQFQDGLVKNKDGKWEYNRTEYKKRQERDKRRRNLLLRGKIDEFKADIEAEQNEEWTPAEEDNRKGQYGRRIDAIMEANQRNQAIDWAVNEVYNGDAVNKLEEVFAEENRKEQTKETKATATTQSQEENPFNTPTTPRQTKWEATAEKRKAQQKQSSEKYKARKQKAKESYERAKKAYKDWKKGNLSATVVPFQDAIAKAANALIYAAKDGSYKFAQFVEDFTEIASDIDIKDVLPLLKKAYNKKYAYYTLKNADITANMSSPEEVSEFGLDSNINIAPEPAATPLHERIQKQFDEDGQKIVTAISTHYDVIVEDGENSAVYVNREAVAHANLGIDNKGITDKVNTLKSANTSDEAFREVLNTMTGHLSDFPVELYVKYRNLDGIEEAIARNLQSTKGQYIQNGIKVRNAVVALLLGNEVDSRDFPSNFGQFKEDVLDVKAKLEGLGLTIINTGEYIYGLDKDGNRVASNVDIIAADASGRVYIIDVRSGYKSVRDRWNKSVNSRINFTIEELVNDQLKQIEDIVNTKFRVPVNGLYCLPVIYNDYDTEGIKIEKSEGGKSLISVKTNAERIYSGDIEQQKKNAKDLVEKINEDIDEYNSLVKEASKYFDEYTELSPIEVQEYTTAAEYSVYMDALHAKYDDMRSRINDLRLAIENQITFENVVWNENAEQNTIGIPSQETEALALRLAEACKELDIVLQYIPDIKATTEAEKQNVQKLYQTIFDAQKALDDLLQDPNASAFDVTAEEELIAYAMEKLAENKDNFGAMSMFMRRWWADNFVIGKGDNTLQGVLSVAQQAAGFVNTINSWVDTLYNHVGGELDNHEALQEWYSSILNRYFSVLLDNAQAFADQQDQVLKAAMTTVIQRGRQLVDAFNEAWGTLPDEDFPGPPANEVERINRMPVAWKDLYSRSTSHSPAFDAMANSTIYYIMSTSPTFTSSYRSQLPATENPDDKSTRFTLYEEKSGEIKLRINWWDGKQWKFEELPFTINIGNYPNATAEDIARYTAVNRANKKFTKKVKRMLEYVAKHPEYTIEFTVTTDKGSVNYDQKGNSFNVTDFLFRGKNNEHDLYTVKLSAEDRIGVGVFITDRNSGIKFYDVRAGKNLSARIGGFDDTFSKQHLNTQNGAIVYFYDSGDGDFIGVPIQSSQIGVESATKLVDLMRRYVTGERMYNGYDIMSLLKLRLYMSDPSRQLSKYNNVSNMITINNDGTVIIGNESYNVLTQRNALIQRLAAMNNSTDAEMLSDNMSISTDQVLQQAKSIFQNDSSLKTITLPNGFVLEREDFTHRNNDGSVGTTWLGYLLRNNVLTTRATSKSYKQINIDNLALVNKNTSTEAAPKTTTEGRANARRRRVSPLSAVTDPFANSKGGLAMTVEEDDIDATRGTEEQELFVQAVKDYFKTVFGSDADLQFEDSEKLYIREASKNQRIIGICTSQMVVLSRYAPYSAMYHEAFHKILELVLPADTRKEFYKIYRSHNKNGNLLSERQVAEGLADLFVDYMSRKVELKNAKWYKKIFKWFKAFGFAFNMALKYGFNNTRKIYTVYQNMNAGKYANDPISDENAARFRREFNDELYYKVNGIELQHIADSGQLSEMAKALGYYILEAYGIDQINPNTEFKIDEFTPNQLSQETIDNLTAKGVPEEELTAVDLAFREILKRGERIPIIPKKGKNKGKTVGYTYEYPNFGAIKKAVSDYISGIVGEYDGKIVDEEVEQEDDGENRSVQQMNIDRYDKASYEFSKLESVNKRVKLFFATIPYYTFDENGAIIEDYSKNIYECPVYMPLEEVYNVLVNKLHDVQNIQDLRDKLKILAQHDPMSRAVYLKYNQLIDGMYTQDENGNLKIDYDREAFAIQILSAIRSQKLDFVTALSKTLEGDNGKEVRIVSSSLDRDSKRFPVQWSQFLQAGQVGVFTRNKGKDGNYVFREGMGGANGTDIFSRTAKFISDLRLGLSQAGDEFKIGDQVYRKDTLEDVALIKQELLSRLHQIGIIFSREALDHMLLNRFGNMGSEGMLNWLSLTGTSSINTFLDKLNQFVTRSGVPNKSVIDEGYAKIGFVRDLANWQGTYNRITTQQMALGLNGKRLFSVSQNSSISHIINMLNTEDMDNETVRTLMGFGYNITNEDIPQGSIILKAIKQRKALNIQAHTYIGFKTDNQGDLGTEYTEEATVDDYIAKMTMLLEGYMIFPTLADKGTWMILSGVEIPGIQFQKVTSKDSNGVERETTVVQNVPTVRWFNREPYIMPSDVVLNQMLEYARTERLAIQQCMEDLGYESIPGYEKQGRPVLSQDAKIKNYHTPNKDKKTKKVIEPNGTRFLSLTKIVVKEVEDGKLVLKEYNLNDPNKSSVELLKLANEKFFSKPLAEQKEIMALTLAIQNRHEVETAIDLGVVERATVEGTWVSADGEHNHKIASGTKSLMNLKTKHLNQARISALTSEFMKQMRWQELPNGREKNFKYEIARSLAIAAILGDVTNKSIISSQEVQRCFSGHPAEFKVDYDVEAGKIKDAAYDIQKRIGGMISTGDDNVLNLPGIPSEYTCAECEDYEVSSAADVAGQLEQMFVDSQIREMFANKIVQFAELNPKAYAAWVKGKKVTFKHLEDQMQGDHEQYAKDAAQISASALAYMVTPDWIRENCPKELRTSIEKAEKDGKKFANSYTGGINVADGASYITDTMCENMLRMRGAYDATVKEAFDILRSEDTKYTWMLKQDAYAKIYDAVNIVTTKYTAYGFRDHMLGDDKVSDVAVAYYNKFALFPLFPCIATGRMADIYEEMQKQGVDMLLMTSAVKVGSQGAVQFDGTKMDRPFNKYTQSYAYLRRQLNTDPEEGGDIVMGTQMVKIGLQNLRLNRADYTHSRTSELISGQELLDSMMNSIKYLAQSGMYELQDMFLNEAGDVDAEKLSKYLKDQLSSRNANKGIIEAIEVVTDPETGIKKLVCPLAATADASWIESILISTINRKVIDIVTPGSSFVQRSVFAIEGKAEEGSIQGDENLAPTINNGERLQMLNEDGSMDAVISMDYFDEIIFKGRLANMSFDAKRKWLFDHGVIGKGAKANTIGYRIPTQAQSSIHALRFVDVVPAVKSTIILPEEFTKITGSDFDIDHLYLASYNYSVVFDSENMKDMAITTFNPLSENRKDDVKYHQNNILDCLLTLLKDSGNSINSLYKSIDNDTELITKISDQIPETGSTKDEPYNFGTLHEQVIRKNDYITGKTGIGPFALNVTNQVLTQLYGVKFRDTRFTKETGICRLDHIIDNDDNMISSWLSAFINAHVDIVKDPYISRLDVNPFTYNMVNLLIRSGFGDTALWFVSQPIIRDMATASEQAKSQYARDPEKGKSTYAATEYAIKQALSKYLTEEEMSPDVLNRYTRSNNKRDIDVRINTVNAIKQFKDVLAEIAKNPTAKKVKVGDVEYDVKNIQKTVFYAWKTLEKYSIALGDLVQHTKIDTRKHGKTLIAINQYLDAYKKLFFDPDPKSSLWDIDSLRRLAFGSWIDMKTRLAIAAPSAILSQQTFAANPEFLKAVILLGNILSTTGGVLNNDTLNLISRSLQTAIKSKYIVKYAREKLGMSDKDIAGLFIGKNSINSWLTMLKTAIETKPEFARLKNNHLLNQIYAEAEDEAIVVRGKLASKPSFVTVLSNVDDSKVNSDLLIDGWTDLLNDEHPNVRMFARKLIVYAFLTSGEFKGWNKMFKYVPPAWIRGEIDTDTESFSEYVLRALLSSSSDYQQFFDDIIANNFMDYRISKRVPKLNSDGTDNFVDVTSIIKVGRYVDGSQINHLEQYITVKESGYAGKGVANYNLYKLAGFISTQHGAYPVYAKMKKKGYHGKNKFDIYEYGWDFGYAENENQAANEFDFASALQRVERYLNINSYELDAESSARALTDVFLGRVEEETDTLETELKLRMEDLDRDNPINIYFGTGENPELSNFASRPIEDDASGYTYPTVEHAFQIKKLDYISRLHNLNYGGPKDEYFDIVDEWLKMSPQLVRSAGKHIHGLNSVEWDKNAYQIMKHYIKLSFEQNPDALQKLLATGNSLLTHTQDKSRWGREFPKILMDVRLELRGNTENNPSLREALNSKEHENC